MLISVAVPCLRLLVAGLSPRSPGFDPRSDHVGFMMDEVALPQPFLSVLRFSPVSIIPPMLHTHLPLYVALPDRQTGKAWEPSKTQCLFQNRGALHRKLLSLFFY